jgi:hypothetical protein
MHKNQRLIPIRAWFLVAFAWRHSRLTIINFVSIFRSPTMAGGLLAAHREYFFEIGGYGKDVIFQFSINFMCLFR